MAVNKRKLLAVTSFIYLCIATLTVSVFAAIHCVICICSALLSCHHVPIAMISYHIEIDTDIPFTLCATVI